METFICADYFRCKFNPLCVELDVPAAPYQAFFCRLTKSAQSCADWVTYTVKFSEFNVSTCEKQWAATARHPRTGSRS